MNQARDRGTTLAVKAEALQGITVEVHTPEIIRNRADLGVDETLRRGFFGTRRWLAPDELPSSIRQLVPPPELGLPDPRATRAALDSRGGGPWRNGWLVIDGRSAVFLYRRAFRTRNVPLPRPEDPTVSNGILADAVSWSTDDAGFTLHLLKDGPSAEIAIGALQLAIR
jgi:hypothetical protein